MHRPNFDATTVSSACKKLEKKGYSPQNDHLNIGSMITDPNYPEDGAGMIVRIDLSARHRDWLSCNEIYRVHSFASICA